jgi:DhnA family fructose-bisphosphate aldolase class Ia
LLKLSFASLLNGLAAVRPVLFGKAKDLRAALDAMGAVVEAGGRGATIGRNVWGVEPATAALKAFKAVILEGASSGQALAANDLTGSE